MIIKVAKTGDVLSIVAVSLFILSLLMLYTISCLYHALGRNRGKKVLRVLDHDMVFVLIMGTYVPYTWIGLRNVSRGAGLSLGSFGPVASLGLS
jgi:hemolysin III